MRWKSSQRAQHVHSETTLVRCRVPGHVQGCNPPLLRSDWLDGVHGSAVGEKIFALRTITSDALTSGVQTADIDELGDLLLVDGQRAIWH